MEEKQATLELEHIVVNSQLKVINSLEPLIDELNKCGYKVIGPKLRNNTISLGEIENVSDLQQGFTQETEKATYSLKKSETNEYFNYTVTPNSWKQYLFPQRSHILNVYKDNHELKIDFKNNIPPKYAFLGVKSCELNAIKIQDKVFMDEAYGDSYYSGVRKDLFIIAVHCSRSEDTCFCSSMNTGPEIKDSYDLLITEIHNNSMHYFLIKYGSEKGKAVLDKIETINAIDEQAYMIEEKLENIVKGQIRHIDSANVKEVLIQNFENPRYDQTAKRCLACGNCTLVCPTCFCSTMEDTTDLKGTEGYRWKKWDSCFNLVYSKVAGGNFRPSVKGRYRQWLTHKFSFWHDQFGTLGCVGCGRCITWCPAKIDVTEEINHITNNPIS